MTINPYDPPLVDAVVVVPTSVHTDGVHLIVESGCVLPLRCIKTNQPISERDMRRRNLYWYPPWIVLIGVIFAYLVRKRCSIVYGLHPLVRRRYWISLLVKVLVLISLFVAIPIVASIGTESATTVVVILFILSFVAMFIGNTQLRVTNWKQGSFWIKGCSREFLRSIDETT